MFCPQYADVSREKSESEFGRDCDGLDKIAKALTDRERSIGNVRLGDWDFMPKPYPYADEKKREQIDTGRERGGYRRQMA